MKTRAQSAKINLDTVAIANEQDDERSDESEAECPKCGLVYGDGDNGLWICCDKCDTWYTLV